MLHPLLELSMDKCQECPVQRRGSLLAHWKLNFHRHFAPKHTIFAEYDPSNPVLPGVFDVRSGAQGLAIDGSSYAEW